MKYPEFIIVSAYKAGTTALWYNLDKHPKIHMAKKKDAVEMNFWKLQFYKRGHDYYKSFFPDGYVCGEKTPGYSLSKASMREIYRYIPECKIIMCVRHPVDRAYSQFQMNYKRNASPRNFTRSLFNRRYARAGKYFLLLKNNIFPFFDESQIYIVVSEYMKKNTTEEMRKLFDFIGVEDLGFPTREIDPILRRNKTRDETVKENRSEKFYRVWTRHPDTLPNPFREEFLNFYKPFNKQLFDYLGYEIKEWNK